MSTYAARTFTQMMNDAREELNDSTGNAYPDARLIAHAARAMSQIESELAKHDINLLERFDTFANYTPGTSEIAVPGAITDFHEPLGIWERGNVAEYWQEVFRRTQLPPPPVVQPIALGLYEWSENKIKVNPASQARLLLVRYRRKLAYPAAGGAVGFENIYEALVFGTAYRAARRTNRKDMVGDLKEDYYRAMKDMVEVESRRLQADTVRWGGFNDEDDAGDFGDFVKFG